MSKERGEQGAEVSVWLASAGLNPLAGRALYLRLPRSSEAP